MVFFFFPGNRQVVGSPGNKEWNGDSHMKPGSTSVKKQIGGKKATPKRQISRKIICLGFASEWKELKILPCAMLRERSQTQKNAV